MMVYSTFDLVYFLLYKVLLNELSKHDKKEKEMIVLLKTWLLHSSQSCQKVDKKGFERMMLSPVEKKRVGVMFIGKITD